MGRAKYSCLKYLDPLGEGFERWPLQGSKGQALSLGPLHAASLFVWG